MIQNLVCVYVTQKLELVKRTRYPQVRYANCNLLRNAAVPVCQTNDIDGPILMYFLRAHTVKQSVEFTLNKITGNQLPEHYRNFYGGPETSIRL